MDSMELLTSARKMISSFIKDIYSVEIDCEKETINVHVYPFAKKRIIKLRLDDILEHQTSVRDFIDYFTKEAIKGLK